MMQGMVAVLAIALVTMTHAPEIPRPIRLVDPFKVFENEVWVLPAEPQRPQEVMDPNPVPQPAAALRLLLVSDGSDPTSIVFRGAP